LRNVFCLPVEDPFCVAFELRTGQHTQHEHDRGKSRTDKKQRKPRKAAEQISQVAHSGHDRRQDDLISLTATSHVSERDM